jgi:hypothetical protein
MRDRNAVKAYRHISLSLSTQGIFCMHPCTLVMKIAVRNCEAWHAFARLGGGFARRLNGYVYCAIVAWRPSS